MQASLHVILTWTDNYYLGVPRLWDLFFFLGKFSNRFKFLFHFSVLPVDLSPKYASFIGSLAMALIALVNLLNPLTMVFMVQNHVSEKLDTYYTYCPCQMREDT